MSVWLAIRENAKQTRMLLTIAERWSNPESPQEEQKNYQVWELRRFLRGLMIWNVMRKSVWNDITSWRTKQRNSCRKFPLHALTSIQSIKIRGRIVRSVPSNCPEMFYLTRIGSDNVPSVKLARAITQWTRACDRLALCLRHSSHNRIQTILSCGRYSSTMSLGTVSRFRFCRRY